MKNVSGQLSSATFPRTGSGAEQKSLAGGGTGGGSEVIRGGGGGGGGGQELRQRQVGQVGGVNSGHMTSAPGGGDHQSSQAHGSQSHTHSRNSPPSIPRKKHSDNSKPVNIATYSAPLSPHSEEESLEQMQNSSPTNNNNMSQAFTLQNIGGQSATGGKGFHSHQYSNATQDHTPSAPRQPPNGYDQRQSYPVTPPPTFNKPPPSFNQSAFSRSEYKGHRRSASSGYGAQAPSSVAMITHRSSLSSQIPPVIVNHSAPEAAPAFNKQLSTKSLQGYPTQSREDPTMTSFSSPTLELPSHNHTPSSSQHNMSASPNTDFYPSQNGTQAPNSAYNNNNGIPISLLSPLVSRGELSVDIEAQSTPEIILPRQPVASGYGSHAEAGGLNSGSGIGLQSISYSYSNTQQVHWSGSQTSLNMSHSSSRTGDSLPSTLVTSSTRTQPTAAINEGGPSSSPLRRKQMGHRRHLSLGNNISSQRPTHARNRSLGSVNFNHILPPSTLSSRQESLGNLSILSHASSKTGSRLSLTSGFLSEAQVPQTPDPENGYDFVQHFNLFSQYTSNMALEYYAARKEDPAHQPTTPPVWCMDVWNRIIVVGCGNGQIEVGTSSKNEFWAQFENSMNKALSWGPIPDFQWRALVTRTERAKNFLKYLCLLSPLGGEGGSRNSVMPEVRTCCDNVCSTEALLW